MWKNRKRLPAQVWDGLAGFVDACAQMTTPAFRTRHTGAGPPLSTPLLRVGLRPIFQAHPPCSLTRDGRELTVSTRQCPLPSLSQCPRHDDPRP